MVCRDDLVNLYIEALQNSSFDGTYNATAPNPVRMSELCSSMGRVLGRPSWLPVPEFALQVTSFICCLFTCCTFICCLLYHFQDSLWGALLAPCPSFHTAFLLLLISYIALLMPLSAEPLSNVITSSFIFSFPLSACSQSKPWGAFLC